MRNFVFHNPTKLIFGKNTITKIGPEIAGRGHGKVVLVAGGGSIRKNGVYEEAVNSLKNSGIKWKEVWGVRPNPVLSKVNEIIREARSFASDAILAVGGGSVIDSAKAAAAGIHAEDVWRLFETREPVERAIPVYTVLTISATGTEMNPYAVITNESEKKKWNISGPALYPVVSIIDPSVQTTLPWKETVNGAVDSLSHIMEYYFMGGESDATLNIDEALSRTIIETADELKGDPGSYEARADLAWCATLALNGISGAGQAGGDWACHGMEHAISAVSPDVAHGTGLGIIFPAWIEYCQNADPVIFKRWAKNIWGKNTVIEGISAMREKIKAWGNPTTLAGLGIDKKSVADIADNAVEFGLTGSLKALTRADIINILNLAKPA